MLSQGRLARRWVFLWLQQISVINPAKVVKFKYSLDNILKHEKQLYPPSERFSRDELQAIFDRYPKASSKTPYII